MAKITIVLKKRPTSLMEMAVDGKKLLFKKNKKRYEAVVETEKTEVDFTVKRYTHLQTRFWWLWEMLFYLATLFGILDMHGDAKKCLQSACRLTLTSAADMTYQFILNSPGRGKKVVRYEDGSPVEEKENLYFVNPALEKRKKGLTVFKALCPILLGVGIIIAIII